MLIFSNYAKNYDRSLKSCCVVTEIFPLERVVLPGNVLAGFQNFGIMMEFISRGSILHERMMV